MKKLIIIGLVLILLPINVLAASNPYPKKQLADANVYTVPCTYVAWDEAYKRTGVALPSWGNAVNWFSKAKNAGYKVGNTPKKNSIAVYSGGCCGHVAYVVDVYEDEELMYIIQGGALHFTTDENGNDVITPANGTGISEGKSGYVLGQAYGGRYLTGFIYLDEVPKNTSSSTNTSSTTTSKKSDNSFLKSLTISNIDFTFDKNNYSYNFDVPNDIAKITIAGEVDNSKAKATGFGEYDLNIGENYFSIKVVAEDKSSSEYVINIKREEIEEEIQNEENEKEEVIVEKEVKKDQSKWNNLYLIPISFVILIFILIIVLIRHIRKNKHK